MYAIAGGKGGCGKTTTAIGLARALAAAGQSPLIIDADVDMPDLHFRLDIPSTPNATSLSDGAHLDCVTHNPPSSPDVAVVPAGTAAATPEALRRLRTWRGPVLVDCPAGAGEDVAVALREADATVLVTTDTPQSQSDARKTAMLADGVGAPVRASLVRGPAASTVGAPVECPHVEYVELSERRDAVRAPETRAAYESLSKVITKVDVWRVNLYQGTTISKRLQGRFRWR